MTLVHLVEDASKENLLDVEVYCSMICVVAEQGEHPHKMIAEWPGFEFPDYDVHCHRCGDIVYQHQEG